MAWPMLPRRVAGTRGDTHEPVASPTLPRRVVGAWATKSGGRNFVLVGRDASTLLQGPDGEGLPSPACSSVHRTDTPLSSGEGRPSPACSSVACVSVLRTHSPETRTHTPESSGGGLPSQASSSASRTSKANRLWHSASGRHVKPFFSTCGQSESMHCTGLGSPLILGSELQICRCICIPRDLPFEREAPSVCRCTRTS